MSDLLLLGLSVIVALPPAGLLPPAVVLLCALPLLAQWSRAIQGRRVVLLPAEILGPLSGGCVGLLVADALWLSRGRLITIALHLTLVLLVLKAFTLHRVRDRRQFALLAFFTVVAAAASATHMVLPAFLAWTCFLFASHLMQDTGVAPSAARRLAASGTAAALCIGIPLFMVFPRLTSAVGSGLASRAPEAASPLSLDRLSLEGANPGAEGERIALRVELPPRMDPGSLLRLRMRTFVAFNGVSWDAAAPKTRFFAAGGMDGAQDKPFQRSLSGIEMRFYPKDLELTYLPLPYGTVDVRAPIRFLGKADDGSLQVSSLWRQRRMPYEVTLEPGGDIGWTGPRKEETAPPALEAETAALARDLMPAQLTTPEKVRRLSDYFSTGFTYGTGVALSEKAPLKDFLFHTRRGHCEIYATAGALLLRSAGVPARVAVGFLGGEKNPFQDYYIIRFKNAHAWVEAWMDRRWQVVDLTPPEARPGVVRINWSERLGLLLETVSFFWDRHVLGFSLEEQSSLMGFLGEHARAAVLLIVLFLGALCIPRLYRLTRRFHVQPRAVRRYQTMRRKAAEGLGRRETALSPAEVENFWMACMPGIRPVIDAFLRDYLRVSFGVARGHPGMGKIWREIQIAMRAVSIRRINGLFSPPRAACGVESPGGPQGAPQGSIQQDRKLPENLVRDRNRQEKGGTAGGVGGPGRRPNQNPPGNKE